MKEIYYFTKEEALKAVEKNGDNLLACCPSFQNDEDVLVLALKSEKISK